jgi:hypothetical protein
VGGTDALRKRIAALRRKDKHAKRQNDSREKRRLNKERAAQRRIPLLERLSHKRWFRAGEWVVGIFGLILTIVGGIYTIAGPIWPTDPEIHPHDVLNGSSFVLPFTVKNRSILFDMPNVEFTCGIDWVYLRDAGSMRGVFGQQAFVNGTYSIKTTQTINYQCDASQLIKVNTDGSISIRTLSLGMPQPLVAPLTINEMCVWIRAEYKIAGLIPRSFTSVVFQWPAGANAPQWIEGPTIKDGTPTTDKYWPVQGVLPAGVVTCAPTPHPIAVLFDRTGKAVMPQ